MQAMAKDNDNVDGRVDDKAGSAPEGKAPYLIESIKAIKLFSQLTNEELQDILTKLSIKKFKKGDVVLYHEDVNDYMYVILSGEARVSRSTDDGREMVVAVCRAGEYFGEMSLLDGQTTSATVTATRESVIAIISRSNFHYLIHSNKKVLDNLLSTLCKRVRGSTETIQMLNYNEAPKRLEMLFSQLAKKYGRQGGGTESGVIVEIKLTHQDIADMTGLTRQTITRVIDEWKNNGDIAVLENKFVHLSQKFLKRLHT